MTALSGTRWFRGTYLRQSVVRLDHVHTGQWIARRLRSSGNQQAGAANALAVSSRATAIPGNLEYTRQQAFLFIVLCRRFWSMNAGKVTAMKSWGKLKRLLNIRNLKSNIFRTYPIAFQKSNLITLARAQPA
ncbi:hypothetical protein [Burkholderia cenocepacia]|uniref:hypothetical protein n=1 Tax=Burkholderia cenocepacia TaxID=95486 RepID=UPI002AB7B996|nr:hypothetical protein [Burkholderia cenocepacia]